MCYSTTCNKCGKSSWGGCGLHVPGVYNSISNKENVCLCKGWPGVQLPADMAAKIPEGSKV